jgi:formyl-CoA transferase
MTIPEGVERAMPAANTGPLSDLKVVEMGQLIAGPFCGQLLGDMGAEVIKIEPPGAGDPMRLWGLAQGLTWEVIARNKMSVSLDLRSAKGQALARRLIGEADVLIENFKPGTLERWDMAPDTLRRANPRLIVARMSGYGQSGPYRERAGFGGIGEAMGGWRRIVGEPDRPPSRMGVSIGDSLTATFGAMGVLAALHHRERTGEGQVVDAALYESVLQVMEGLVSEYSAAGVTRERSGAILPGIAPSNVYPCQDGEYMIGANNDSIFRRLAQAMGQPGLADDPRYRDHVSRGRNQGELDELIGRWTATLSVEDLEAKMLEASIPAGRLYAPADMVADPHFAAREAIVAVDHPSWPGLKMQGVFPKLSATPGAIRSIAPQVVGAHNGEILGGRLGLPEAELKELRAAGVI